MRKALIFGLTLAAALSLAACGKPHQPPEPAAASAPTDASATTPPPAPPADADPAPQDPSGHGYLQSTPDESAASVPAETEADLEDDQTEPLQTEQTLPDIGEVGPSAPQPDPTEEEPPDSEPDSAGSSDNEADDSALSEELISLIQAYLSSQSEESQQSGAEYNPTDISRGLAAYWEHKDDIQASNPEELREAAEKIFPDAAKYDINWDMVWQAMEAGLFG